MTAMTTAPLSTLVAINALASTRPSTGAPARLVADWYERKATMLHQVATESVSDQDTWEALAVQAHAHAVRLLNLGRG